MHSSIPHTADEAQCEREEEEEEEEEKGGLLGTICVTTILCASLALAVFSPFLPRFPWHKPSPSEPDMNGGSTGNTNHTLPASVWSRGNAVFTISAVCFAYVAQPSGSTITANAGRIWRLAPVLALADILNLIVRLVSFWVAKYRYKTSSLSWTAFASALLAARSAADVEIPEETMESESIDHSSIDMPSTNESTDADYAVQYNTTEESGKVSPAVAAKSCNKGQSSIRTRPLVLAALERVPKFENRPSFRLFIWAPMLLQLIKLWCVSGAPLARTIGFTFFFAWLSTEALLVLATYTVLAEDEKDVAEELALRIWLGYCRCGASIIRIANILQSFMNIFLLTGFFTGGWTNIDFFTMSTPPEGSDKFGSYIFGGFVYVVTGCWYVAGLELLRLGLRYIQKNRSHETWSEYDSTQAIATAVLLALCFLGTPPFQDFYDPYTTWKPRWYDWLG